MMELPHEALAVKVLETSRRTGLKIATAESCTGGMVAAALTDIAGSSDVIDRGFVTYSNEAKSDLLGVDSALTDPDGPGAVSEDVARAMARGALAASGADLTVAITGIAGPGGGSAEKPVGLVHFGWAFRDGADGTEHVVFGGNRAAIREAATGYALNLLLKAAQTAKS